MMGEAKTELIEIIGRLEVTSNEYAMRSFDNEGNVVTMTGEFQADGGFTIHGEGIRATQRYHQPTETMSVMWQRLYEHSVWKPWLSMNLTRDVL
jgi:hypothetical protein